ncbi:MAG: DUF3048 domain-containing protein [Acidimicrobiia bacterium]|nr:DUF3048 domain-containing protein [Acidimicrobiia bacterium]
MRLALAGLATAGLILTACNTQPVTSPTTAAAPDPTTTLASSSTSSTTLPVARTTPTSTGSVSRINGMEVDDPTLLDRRILAVKIDNHSRARPQSGIQDADMVIEMMVEGITRFITIWHESDSDYLGPVRSGRPTDAALLQALNEPTFAISGAQDWVYGLFTTRDIHLLGQSHDGLFRISARSAPHNLYADTTRLRASAERLGYPDAGPAEPLWEFGPMSEYAPPATSVRINFSSNIVNWLWDPGQRHWLRSTWETPSMWRAQDGETGRIAVPVLVALYVDLYQATPSGPGSPVPASRTTGTGKAFVFADGRVVEGTWTRPSESDWFLLTDGDGELLYVPPGKVWVSLVPSSTGLSYSD